MRTVPLREFTRTQKTPTCISLFTGAGGAALGIRKAGFEVRVMVEWDKAACATLRANWLYKPRKPRYSWHQKREPAILEADITKLPTKAILEAGELEVGEATLVEGGGFPCQGFSTAGKRMIDDPRNALYKQCVRVIREALPRFFMLENVPGLVSMDKGRIIDRICRDLAACGYGVRWDILNAADYGVPQMRRRVFFVGWRNDFLALQARGRMRYHMGAFEGEVLHPEWYLKKYQREIERRLPVAA